MSYFKNYSANLFICPCLMNLKSVERKGKKYKDLNILKMKRAFQVIKTFFTVSEGMSFGEKIKKIAKTSFNFSSLRHVKGVLCIVCPKLFPTPLTCLDQRFSKTITTQKLFNHDDGRGVSGSILR